MARIPVWVDSWALSCCLGVIALGQTREVTLVAYEIEDLQRPPHADPTWEASPDGTITFTARVLSVSPGGPVDVALLDLGDLFVAAENIEGSAAVSGRTGVWNEPHWQFASAIGEKATMQGNGLSK